MKKKPLRLRWGMVAAGVVLISAVGATFATGLHKRGPDDVAARVNGEAIYERDLNQAMPAGSFGPTLENLKEYKLGRLVDEKLRAQFLKTRNIAVSEQAVAQTLDAACKTPPVATCGCCYFDSLDAFLEANYYTVDEYAGKLRNDLGFKQYTGALWQQAQQSRAELLRTWRPDIEAGYCKVSRILCREYSRDHPEAETKARAAWQRLESGEAFAKLARELSDDSVTSSAGGAIGCFSIYQPPIDIALMKDVQKLPVGKYSAPLKSIQGYEIFRREEITDDDILRIAQDSFVQQKTAEAYNQMMQSAKIEYVGRPQPEGVNAWK